MATVLFTDFATSRTIVNDEVTVQNFDNMLDNDTGTAADFIAEGAGYTSSYGSYKTTWIPDGDFSKWRIEEFYIRYRAHPDQEDTGDPWPTLKVSFKFENGTSEIIHYDSAIPEEYYLDYTYSTGWDDVVEVTLELTNIASVYPPSNYHHIQISCFEGRFDLSPSGIFVSDSSYTQVELARIDTPEDTFPLRFYDGSATRGIPLVYTSSDYASNLRIRPSTVPINRGGTDIYSLMKVPYSAIYASSGNLFEYGDGEDASNAPTLDGGVIKTNVSFTQTTTVYAVGSAAYRLIASTGTGNVNFIDTLATDDMHGITVNKKYTFRAWLNTKDNTDPTTVTVYISEYHTGTWNDTTLLTLQEEDEWKEFVVNFTTNSNTTGFAIYLDVTGGDANCLVFIDDIYLVQRN